MPDDKNGISVPENQNPDHGNEDQIPDWMKDAGWEESSGTFDESKPIFDDLEDDEDEIVPADIPAWLEEAAPEGFSPDPNAIPAFEGLEVDEPFITTGDLVPPPSMEQPAKDVISDQSEETDTGTPDSGLDIPSWLENLELDEDSQETAVAWLENMPESLRASEEELEAAATIPADETENIEEPVDDLAWIDELDSQSSDPSLPQESESAALSEDLIASDLIPETGDSSQIFDRDEIEIPESDLPSWLEELGQDQPESHTPEEIQEDPSTYEQPAPPESKQDTGPDWLQPTEEIKLSQPSTEPDQEPALPISDDSGQFPDWLSDFDESPSAGSEQPDGLEWLDSLPGEEISPETPEGERIQLAPEEIVEEAPSLDSLSEETSQAELISTPAGIPSPEEVSPNDETLNAQVPDWLSKIGESEDIDDATPPARDEIDSPEALEPVEPSSEFESGDSWLDQIHEAPLEVPSTELPTEDSEVMEWLDEKDGPPEEQPLEDIPDLRESMTDVTAHETPPIELETSKYLSPEEQTIEEPAAAEQTTQDASDDLPDWLSELREDEDDQSGTLEEAIRQADHALNEEEIEFLSQADEKNQHDADWLSELDQAESQSDPTPSIAPIQLDPTDEEFIDDIPEEIEVEPATGGMLDRLKDTSEFKSAPEVPQWLEDLKEEEDPQETAVLWLQQFVNKGDKVDIDNEIKRYTDELDPGDAIPKWMEDLKHEEDPQTTAMLWLEKLSSQRQAKQATEPAPADEEVSDWLADLEKEASESSPDKVSEEIKDFGDSDQGWLADLEINDKIKTTEEEIPDWSKAEAEDEETSPESEPPWLKATSPLEGDFYTDELAGGEEKEVEIPEWLAGYAEGEKPPETPEESPDEDEYTWLSAKEAPSPAKTPLDLNIAAISQLESILGISHYIAKGIVTYRENNGPFHDLSDLMNVPEITDELTIEILKPEVTISEVFVDEGPPKEQTPPEVTAPTEKQAPPAPEQKPVKKKSSSDNFEEILATARTYINDRDIAAAIENYTKLIKKKKFLAEIIDDLQKAALDHPLEIAIQQTLGDVFMQQDMLDEALEAYSKAEDLLS